MPTAFEESQDAMKEAATTAIKTETMESIQPYISEYECPGSGTEGDPYVIGWPDGDAENPLAWSSGVKWYVTAFVAMSNLAVGFCSSEYAGASGVISHTFGVSPEVATLGMSIFVLGFAIGPFLWGPLSEVYGRRPLFIWTYVGLTAFNAGSALAPDMPALIVLRFFAGAFGASPLTNAGGTVSDMFSADQRGVAMSVFAAAPFMGVVGPIVGGFAGQRAGCRWALWILALFTGTLLVIGLAVLPETYAPVLLQERAAKLSKATGKVYRSKFEAAGRAPLRQVLKTALTRPWALLFREPIVFLLSVYMAIIYGILYMLFAAFPIVYTRARGWSAGVGALPFNGIAVGVVSAVTYMALDNRRYIRAMKAYDGFAPPEARLPPALIGAVAIPVGLFWFALTNGPSTHWIVSALATAPFGFGMMLLFMPLTNYLVDSYTVYAASVLAASTVMRSLFGAVFPLFTSKMYDRLGPHLASALPGFLALACMPFPVLLWRYGAQIRARCRYTAEAAKAREQAAAAATPRPMGPCKPVEPV